MKNSEETAFPLIFENQDFHLGLTKREYFAAMAMQGILSNSKTGIQSDRWTVPVDAVRYADELLKQLEE